jgi:hypothetical protein
MLVHGMTLEKCEHVSENASKELGCTKLSIVMRSSLLSILSTDVLFVHIEVLVQCVYICMSLICSCVMKKEMNCESIEDTFDV